MGIDELNYDKRIELNSQKISQTKSKVHLSILNQMDSIVNVVNSLKEAKSTNDEYKALTENILRLNNENELLSETLDVFTHELERYRNFQTEYESYGDNCNYNFWHLT